MEKKTVRTDYPRINEAESIEEILCLSVLVAKGILDDTNTTIESQAYYNGLKHGCQSCPFCNICLACIINE